MALLVGLILACRIGGSEVTRPTVVITFPQAGSALAVGQEIIVQAVAVDARGVARVELWVNGQSTYSQTVSPAATSFTVNQAWSPVNAGRHILEMRAFNLDNQTGEPAQVVVTVAQAPAVAQVPTLPPAGTGVPPETGVPVGETPAANASGPMVTALVNLNVRSGPGVDYPAIGALPAGQSALIVGQNGEGSWWQVVYQSGSGPGWISGSAKYSTAVVTGEIPVVEVPPPPTPTPTATGTPTPTPEPTATPIKAIVYGLTTDRDTVLVGESIVLRWNLNNVKTALLRYNDREEQVTVPGSKTFYPITTTTYSLVVPDEVGEEVTAQLTVRVNDARAAEVPVLRDGKTRIIDGQTIDFDQGILGQADSVGADFSWDGQAKKFLPRTDSAAALLDMPYETISLADCRFVAYRESLPQGNGATGINGCYRTGEGRYGKFLVSEWDSAGNLTLVWLTWDYR